jgi:hypothetical protein
MAHKCWMGSLRGTGRLDVSAKVVDANKGGWYVQYSDIDDSGDFHSNLGFPSHCNFSW